MAMLVFDVYHSLLAESQEQISHDHVSVLYRCPEEECHLLMHSWHVK